MIRSHPALCFCAVLVLASIGSLNAQSRSEWKGSREWKKGVEIIRNPKEPLYDEKIVSFTEDFRLETDSAMSHGIIGINGIAVDKSGKMFILDKQACCVHVFDANGKPVREIGRRGDGPGEFNNPRNLVVSPNGELYVWDLKRITFYSPDGQYLQSYPNYILNEIEQCLIDEDKNIFGVRYLMTKETYTRDAVKCDSSFNPIQLFESFAPPESKNGKMDPFRPKRMKLGLTEEGLLVVATQDRYELRLYDSTGQLKKRILRAHDRLPVNRKEKEKIVKETPEGFPLEIADFYPPWNYILCGNKGYIFVKTYEKLQDDDSALYDIFDKDGRFVVKTPIAKGWIYCIKGDHIYMVEQDEEGYPALKRMRITWNH